MKTRIVFALALLTGPAASAAATLHVSPQGKPGAAGTADAPLPSPAAAREAIRALRAKGEKGTVNVLLREGVYRLDEPLALKREDSDVTWAAHPGERPVLSGGRVIRGWTRGERGIWSAPCEAPVRQLFVNGRRAQRARTPNNGFYRIDGPSSQETPFVLRFRGNDIRKAWAGSGAEVIALLAWAEIRMPIVSVDEAARTATLTGDPRKSNRESDARYWVENAPDGLDAAGEFLHDAAAGVLRYRPVAGEDLERDEAVAAALPHVVRIEGARNVTFRGIDFRHADWSMGPRGYADMQAANEAPSAFEATGAENVTIERCSFSQSGGYAVWFGRGSKNCRVLACEIFDMGAGGIRLGETVMREEEADRNEGHTLADNSIHDLGLVYPAAVGIWVGQSNRNAIAHNDIFDLYYTAISVGWTWGYTVNQSKGHTIEFNRLHHIGKDMLSDMGAIYTLGEQPGTVIRNNLIHDVSAFTYGGWGIYPDEGSSGILIENNVVYRTKSAGFHQHYGRGNTVRNNIFAFGREFQLMRTKAEPHLSFTFENNIVYFNQGKLLGGNWTGGGLRMNRNVYWDARGGAVRTAEGQDAESAVADPLFANPAAYDFTLRPDSPALKLGFRPIDVRRAGPRVRPGV